MPSCAKTSTGEITLVFKGLILKVGFGKWEGKPCSLIQKWRGRVVGASIYKVCGYWVSSKLSMAVVPVTAVT